MNWKVSKETITVFPHHNADSLELAKVGHYQLVVGKGQYRDGDEVLFIPAKSLIPDALQHHFPHLAHGGRVKVLYRGPLAGADVFALAKGRETVSGEGLHIREGCVITPAVRRRAADGLAAGSRQTETQVSKIQTTTQTLGIPSGLLG